MTTEPVTAHELHNGSHREGVFFSVEGAKERAQAKLDEYAAMYEGFTEEELESSQPLTTTTLEWQVERIDMHGRARPADDRIAWDTLIARYSETGYFAIRDLEIGR